MENENNQDPSINSPHPAVAGSGQASEQATSTPATPEVQPAEPVAVPTEQPVPTDPLYSPFQGGGTSPIEIVDTSASAKASADKAEPIPVSPTPEPINLPTPPLEGGQNPPSPLYPASAEALADKQGGETAPSPIKNLLLKAKEVIQFRKRKKLEKILGLAQTKQKITNNDVEKFLRVSDATATRYLSQLVKEGKLTQAGWRGGAFYLLP